MKSPLAMRILLGLYLVLFFAYLFLPLIFMSAAAFNDSRFPTMLPWEGFTTQWFYGFDRRGQPTGLFQDTRLRAAIVNSFVIAAGVIVLAVSLGLAGALFISNLKSRAKSFYYGVLVSPLLTPGVIIGISTLIFWNEYFGVGGGMLLTIIAQSTFIAAYCMLLFLARLERFDHSLQEAALDLGASHFMVFRRIILPFMKPAVLAAAVIAFLQSFENYNTTLFVIGTQDTMTLNIASRVRLGLTPAINAIGVILIGLTIIGAIVYEWLRRRQKPEQI